MFASAIYQGSVRHRRFTPSPHSFRYQVFMMYLDLDELESVFCLSPWWSLERFNLACFRRRDYLNPETPSLKQAVIDKVRAETGDEITGPVRMLCNVRHLGYVMNPICCYYCFAPDGTTLTHIVADVSNTPWNERHSYVLTCLPGRTKQRFTFAKRFHVSPFHPLNMQYQWYSNTPARSLVVQLENHDAEECVTDATLCLHRQEITATALNRILRQHPWMTLKVIVGIYWQALRLWIKKTPFYPHQTAPQQV